LKRGEISWYTFRLPDKRRPVLILTRSEIIERLNEIIVVPVTRTIRGLTTEVILTSDDGMLTTCALNFDHISLAQRRRIGPCVNYRKRSGRKCVERSLLHVGLEARGLANMALNLTKRVKNHIDSLCSMVKLIKHSGVKFFRFRICTVLRKS
jgi:mRNA interferase MazF